MQVQVAIDLALDRLFTYEVPEALQKKLAVGQLLSVPFGHREARGFAMALGESFPAAASAKPLALKPITAIADDTPFFSPALLELVRQVATYTASPLELVLKAALPAAVLKKNARARELLYVEAVADGPAEAGSLTGRQQWLYEQLVRLGGGWLQPLCRELKTTPATLRELAQCGYARIEVRARRRDPLGAKRILPTRPLPLNEGQAAALKAMTGPAAKPLLLFGITGSGKTEVYLQAIAAELAADRGAIVMVPEISLTPQTVQRFASRFGRQVAVLHSALSDGERYDEWHRIRSGEARVVVGPRSAVWAPVRRLGLIVVDEEHETSYKQDETPRYHARDVAVLRGKIEGCRVVLGSATPSLESWMNVRRGKYELAELRQRAGAGTLPRIELVDMNEEARRSPTGGCPIFSKALLAAIQRRLDSGEQTILFLNRRGYASSLECEGCGWVPECPDCGVPYTYHRADACLRCHICGGWTEVPKACPNCHTSALARHGIGTQRAEAALAQCFPRARILRMDADSTSRKHSHDDLLGAFRRGEAEVLIGTQMIAKGLDFPKVTLVGVLDADRSLSLPDFRAAERTYQLLAQVAGRAGRAELPGQVFIQSRNVSEPVILSAAAGDFAAFAAMELKAREQAYFPPFCHFAVINLRAQDLQLAGGWAELYAKSLQNYAARLNAKSPEVRMVAGEAMPAALEKAEGWYRWQVTLRATTAAALVRAWRWLVEVRPPPNELRLHIDIDAFNLL